MIRTISVVEDAIYVAPPKVVTVPAATATVLMRDQRAAVNPGVFDELVQRLIQNTSSNENLYVSFGLGTNNAPVCDNVNNYHCVLGPGQQRDVSNDRGIVCGYAVNGTVVAVECRWRQTNVKGISPIAP